MAERDGSGLIFVISEKYRIESFDEGSQVRLDSLEYLDDSFDIAWAPNDH